jgi:hypothetical protein
MPELCVCGDPMPVSCDVCLCCPQCCVCGPVGIVKQVLSDVDEAYRVFGGEAGGA